MLQFMSQKFDFLVTQPATTLYDKIRQVDGGHWLDTIMEAMPKSRDYRVTFVPLWRVDNINEGVGSFVLLLWILAKNGQLRSQLENDPTVRGKHPFELAIVPTYRADVIHKIVKDELKYRRDNNLPEPTHVSEIRGPEDYLKKLTTGPGAPLALAGRLFANDKNLLDKWSPDNETITLKMPRSKTTFRERVLHWVAQWVGLQPWIASPFARRGKLSLINTIGAVFKIAAIGAIASTAAVGAFASVAGLGLWGLLSASVATPASTALAGLTAAIAGSGTFGFLFNAVRYRYGISPYDNNIDRTQRIKDVIARLPEVEGKGPKRRFRTHARDNVRGGPPALHRQHQHRQRRNRLGGRILFGNDQQQQQQQALPLPLPLPEGDVTPQHPQRFNIVNNNNNNNQSQTTYAALLRFYERLRQQNSTNNVGSNNNNNNNNDDNSDDYNTDDDNNDNIENHNNNNYEGPRRR